METTGITTVAQTGGTTSTNAPRQKTLGQDEFLLLLTTQLKYQDPLKPTDNTAFVAELAQFSALEQSTKQVKLLEQGLEAQAAGVRYGLMPLVGREVKVKGALIELGSQPAALTFSLEKAAASVKVSILDMTNRVVRVLDLGQQPAGEQRVVWDGKDQNGTQLAQGVYRYAVGATEATGIPVTATASSWVRATGMRFDNNQPMLLVGNSALDPQEVLEVR
jgi:flagellar basal-body rod modification protein FlgD